MKDDGELSRARFVLKASNRSDRPGTTESRHAREGTGFKPSATFSASDERVGSLHPLNLTAILVHYSRPELLNRCVESIRSSSGLATDVLVVDNSPAGFVSAPVGVKVIRGGPGLGYGAAINRAVELHDICDEYFLAANTDVEFHRDALRRLLDAARLEPRAGLLGPALYEESHFTRPSPVYALEFDRYLFKRTVPPEADEPHEVDYVDGAAMLIKTEVFAKIGGFDGRFFLYCEDADLSVRTRLAGFRCLRVPGAKVFHVGHGTTGKTSPLSLYHGLRSSLYFASKHSPAHARAKVFGFVLLEAFRRAAAIGRKGVAAAAAAAADFFLRRRGPEPRWIRRPQE